MFRCSDLVLCLLQVLENCIDAVHECLEEYQGNGAPTLQYFSDLRGGMTDAVLTKHCKESVRGWEGFMELCNLTSRRVAFGSWSMERVDEMLLKFVSATETPHLMPTQQQFKDAKALAKNPHWDKAVALSVAISQYGRCMQSKTYNTCLPS